jgi:RHS repeat-associated protein
VDFCQAPAAGGVPLKFAGMERDASSGIDYDHARYMASLGGRFLGADMNAGRAEAPRTWNRYTYAGGNPLKNVDPDGREVVTVTFRAFIPYARVFAGVPFRGDDRGFTVGSTNRFRTQQIIRVETDPGKSGSHPELWHQFSVGKTVIEPFGPSAYAKGVTGGDTMRVSAQRDASGNVIITAAESVHNPLAPGANPVTYTMTVTIDPSGNTLSLEATHSASPAFEVNVSTEVGTSFALFRSDAPPLLFFGGGLFTQGAGAADCSNANSQPSCTQTPPPPK